ncbi:sigma 54-interacting transcriptional regulator [Desulfatitalea alkaliphila]|uniref:Sigma 54-interacting transcriptional regulator n=1 Tax=Desulfatitalea alkaliphila TaxID=2929485 RepID=A0AA41R7Q6_9BACT|nr:sigma 54-interacting transcriptional regulator [Desulfatitalea alkaliphila]MCJ8502760.1 sigma 54-interacting transcriptional regulator [Desulfatitalea alkaliphila]
MNETILVVDDDPGHLTTLKTLITSWGYRVEGVDDGTGAVERIQQGPVDLILMDVRMARMSGIDALKEIKAYNPAIPIIIMTAYSSVASAVEALKAGAYDYLIKPLDFDALKISITRAREHAGLKAENRQLKAKLGAGFHADNIIGRSPAMKALLDTLAMAAPAEATVLIAGESGTGKELIARSIHFNSPRRDNPLVVVNCAAIAETLLESELFGHEKGAFTGADRTRPGRFEQADGGTLFLDEVSETTPTMQAKLLRAIQEREVQRVGGRQTLHVDVRILAATNRDLAKEVAEGRFREDLFYRLNVITLEVPPLRRRSDDIPLLAQHFLKRYAAKNRKTVKGFSPQAMDLLLKHDWPGNVRELENAVERAVILMTGDYITEKELPATIAAAEEKNDIDQAKGAAEATAAAVDRPLEEIEREAILAAVAAAGGNKSEAARRLGITRKTLHNKLKQYGEM